MKQERQDYLNGYELSKLHGFIKANGDMHEPNYVGFVERLASGF